jgi:hypothetical protein
MIQLLTRGIAGTLPDLVACEPPVVIIVATVRGFPIGRAEVVVRTGALLGEGSTPHWTWTSLMEEGGARIRPFKAHEEGSLVIPVMGDAIGGDITDVSNGVSVVGRDKAGLNGVIKSVDDGADAVRKRVNHTPSLPY